MNMGRSTKYYTLMGSLSALPPHFEEADRVPISSLQLDERLKMLEPRDAVIVDQMSDFLVWERQPLERSDADVIAIYDKFMASVDDSFARALIRKAMTIRTIMAGLRRRRLGLDPPLGVPQIAAQIARNWAHPDFRLGLQFAWIGEFDAELNGDSPFDLEKRRLNIVWQHIKRLAENQYFNFEAVVLYLIGWEVVYRWTRRDAKEGERKFAQLVSGAMGEYDNMFEQT